MVYAEACKRGSENMLLVYIPRCPYHRKTRVKNMSYSIDSDLTSYLTKGETILGRYGYQNKTYYATDRRLIIYQKENFLDIAYKHIVTINYIEKDHPCGLKISIIGGIIGIIIGIKLSIALPIIIVFGIIFGVIIGAVFAKNFKMRNYTLTLSSGETTILPVNKKTNAEAFIKIVREEIYEQSPKKLA